MWHEAAAACGPEYMLWEEMGQYSAYRQQPLTQPPAAVPGYHAQPYMQQIYPEAGWVNSGVWDAGSDLRWCGQSAGVWAGEASMPQQWRSENAGQRREAEETAALWRSKFQRGISHSRGTSSTESLFSAMVGGGSDGGADTPELPTPPVRPRCPPPTEPPREIPPNVPGGYAAAFVVKNTFIETEADTDDEAEHFVQKRLVRTCPGSPTCRFGLTSSDALLLAAAQRLRDLQERLSPPSEPPAAQGSGLATPDFFASEELLEPQELAALEPPEVHVLRLADVLGTAPAAAAAAKEQLPSVGSAGHEEGSCKPCAFAFLKGCRSGEDCTFCHLCRPDSARRRKKDWRRTCPGSRASRRSADAGEFGPGRARAPALTG